MQCDTRPRITALNPYLLCVLCGGYIIDATSIVECLHSFCKTCIVRSLETRKYCPICDVLVHKTEPLQSLRPDTQIQSIVYKLIPNLYEKEMRNRRNYYKNVHPSLHPVNMEEKGEISEMSNFFSSWNTIDFTLEYVNYEKDQQYYYVASNSKRYFRCKASVTIEHIRKLIEAKYASRMKHEIRFFYNQIQLPENLTVLDIAYMSAWKRHGSINIFYDIKLAVQNSSMKTEPPPALAATIAPCSEDALALTTAVVTSNTPPPTPPPSVEIASVKDDTNICEIITKKSENEGDATECIENQSLVLPKVGMTNTSAFDPSNTVVDQTENTVVLCNISTSTNPSTPSVTATCSTNSDGIPVSSVGKPITTSSYELPINEVPSSQANKMTDSNLEEPQMLESDVRKQIAEAKQTAEITKEKGENLPESPTSVKRSIDLEATESVAATKTSLNDVIDTAPSPAKIPKLSELAERVQPLVDPNVTKIFPFDVRTDKSLTTSVAISSAPLVTHSTSNIALLGSLKTSAVIAPVPRLDCSLKNSPRSIFTRPGVPMITKSTTKIMKTFTRPWNSTSTNPLEGVNDKLKSTKVIKARSTPPRYSVDPVIGNRPTHEVTTVTMSASKAKTSCIVEEAKKSAKIFPVMKIDPQTLSPISAPSTTLNSALSPLSSGSLPAKKTSTPFSPYLPVTASTASGPFPSSTSSTHTPSSKPLGPYMMTNSLLPINQLMYQMYGNGGTKTLEYMKAMTTNFCTPPMFHPSIYGSLPRSMNSKYEKSLSRVGVKISDKLPPTEQRIPPSNNNNNNNNTKLAMIEHSSGDKRYTSSSSKNDSVLNSQLKNSTKKTSETSSFLINNLIPSEMGKSHTPSHSCNADGVHQICDQKEPQQNHEQSTDYGEETTLMEKKSSVENKTSGICKK